MDNSLSHNSGNRNSFLMEVKSMAKSEKNNVAGVKETTHKCVLKGSDLAVEASLTLVASDQKDLARVVSQIIGDRVRLVVEAVNANPV